MNLLDQIIVPASERVLVEDVDHRDVVVYDTTTDEAHLLSGFTATVWRSISEAPKSVGDLLELAADAPGHESAALAWEAVEQLVRAGLLASVVRLPDDGMSRRSLLKKLAVGAVAVPVILTVAASPAAAARSGVSGAACTSGCQCVSGFCNPATNQCDSCGNGAANVCNDANQAGGSCSPTTGNCSGTTGRC